MSDETTIEFVVIRKVILTDKSIGVGIAPVAGFDPENRNANVSFFSDKPRSGFIIGGVYSTSAGKLEDGKLVTISVKGATFVRAHEADFTEAKLEDRARQMKADRERFAKKLKSEPALSFEVKAIAAAIKRLPRHMRYDAMSVVTAAISDELWS